MCESCMRNQGRQVPMTDVPSSGQQEQREFYMGDVPTESQPEGRMTQGYEKFNSRPSPKDRRAWGELLLFTTPSWLFVARN